MLSTIPSEYSQANAADAPPEVKKDELTFSISESKEPIEKPDAIAVAPAQDMSAERIAEMAKRLNPMKAVNKKAFVIPEDSLVKPKLPGIQTMEAFPPKETGQSKPVKPVVSSVKSPLKVTRISHEGLVDEVKQLALSFSQPMVPISEARAFDTVPFIQMKPQPAGKWKWAGTQTVLFDPEKGRLPKSTEYKITIPAGTESANGAKSTENQTYTITTPTVRLTHFQPPSGSPQVVSPKMVAVFDQEIDRKTVLKLVRVTAGKTEYQVRMLDDAKIEGDPQAKYVVQNLPKNQWVGFESTTPFPQATTVKVTFPAGLPSAEGPLKTPKEQSGTFAIHGPLKLVSSPENGVSAERYAWKAFQFSNSIDNSKEKFNDSMVKISPATDADVHVSGMQITLQGKLKPFTKYSVTFDSKLTDVFGQSLGKNVTGTFTTGALQSQLGRIDPFNTIPASGKPVLSFFAQAAQNVKVTIYRTSPEDWLKFEPYRYDDDAVKVGTVVDTKTFKVGDEDVMIDLDLKPYLKKGKGQFVVHAALQGTPKDQKVRFASWVQVTDISVDAFRGKNLVAMATSLDDGASLQGAEVVVLPSSEHGTTDAAGLTKLAISSSTSKSQMLVVRKGDDVAILPSSNYHHSGWAYSEPRAEINWYTVTDRQLYKPGEKVSVKGWARGFHYNQNEGIKLFQPQLKTVSYKVSGYDGKELATGEADVDAVGGYTFEIKLPEKMNLGDAVISITGKPIAGAKYPGKDDMEEYVSSMTGTCVIKIQEFRRPEFEMKVASSAGSSMLLGDKTSLTAKTEYYAGGALQDAPIMWMISGSQTAYTPPGWSEFTFGHSSPFWSYARPHRIMPPHPRGGYNEQTKSLSGVTDASGKHTVDLKATTFAEPVPYSFRCEATVSDVNRQSWSDNTSILVHAADRYVGVKPGKWFYKRNEPVDLQIVATDIDGKVKAGSRVVLKLLRNDKDGKEVEVTRQEISSGEHVQKINLMPKQGGQHYVVATVFDAKERRNETRVSTWIEGDTPAETKKAQLQNLVLIPDHKEYQPGDQAEVLVSSPFYPAHGILTLRRNQIVSTIPFDMDSSSKSIKFRITADHFPNLTIEAYVAGKNFSFASGQVEVKVPPRAKTLSLKAVAAEKELAPGSDTTIDIDLKGADGKPVANGQVALAVADESVLALAGYKWEDPIETFYPASTPAIQNSYARQYVLLPKEERPMEQSQNMPPAAPMTAAGGFYRGGGGGQLAQLNSVDRYTFFGAPTSRAEGAVRGTLMAKRKMSSAEAEPQQASTAITMRSDFAALALFVPAVLTDANGKAQVKLHLPDSLTRYRIMAAAIAGDDAFGSTESNVTARLPLMVKPSAPRFLHFGDKCELPVVLQNQTEKPLKVEVVLRANNARLKDISSERTDRTPGQSDSPSTDGVVETVGKMVEVPAKNRIEVRFPVATIDEGNANFQCAVASGNIADASEFAIPVLVPATLESFAAYGQIDKGGILQKLDVPTNIFDQVGGLSVTTSSTAVQALTDAYLYLKDYQYGCSEQISSRMIAMLSLKDVLVAFGKIDAAEQTQFNAIVNRDIDSLCKRQNSNGSFGLWKVNEEKAWPYVSIQVAQALSLAKEKDYAVDPQVLSRGEHYLKNIEAHLPKDYGERAKIAIIARALNVRYLLKDKDPNAARSLIRRALKPQTKKDKQDPPVPLAKMSTDRAASDLTLETAGWLLPIISGDADSAGEVTLIRRLIDSSVRETASTASTNDIGYGDWGYCIFYSPRRTDAIVLEALMVDQPQSELIPKLVKGLLAHRKNGQWVGTQENGYILQALDKYFGKYERVKPDFESQAWLGDTLVGLQKFVGRSTESKIVSVPMSYLLKKNEKEILINKEGAGRLYYRIGLDYAPQNLNLKPADFGFSVERKYEAVDNPADVKQDADGTWHFKSGATVRAKLNFKTLGARYHVAMMDPLAAGTEPVNSDLSGSRTQVPGEGGAAPIGGRNPRAPKIGLIEMHRPAIWWWWPRTWFEHQNLRDHQAEAFQSLLFAGSYDYTYLVRATTPGDYIVPPTKVEEMYQTETFGRSGSDHVIVE